MFRVEICIMNKDDDLNSEKMVEKCCSCVGWGSRSGT